MQSDSILGTIITTHGCKTTVKALTKLARIIPILDSPQFHQSCLKIWGESPNQNGALRPNPVFSSQQKVLWSRPAGPTVTTFFWWRLLKKTRGHIFFCDATGCTRGLTGVMSDSSIHHLSENGTLFPDEVLSYIARGPFTEGLGFRVPLSKKCGICWTVQTSSLLFK